ASVVQSVAGLDESLQAHPHYTIAKHVHGAPRPKVGVVPHDVTGCVAAQNKQSSVGGFLPGDLAAAYGYDGLITGGSDGSTQTIGFVEFSNYNRADAKSFRNCFTGITGTFAPDTSISGGPAAHKGQVEVNLDLEVAMGAAPDATWKVYKAPNNLALLPTMLSKMRTDGVTIVSDSWGLCELAVPVKLTANENTALELLAASGASFYVASGDDGSTDCRSLSPNAAFLAIDDPSGQPFATAVGGTNLRAPPHGAFLEKAWKGSGGGISINWPKPQYQVGNTPDVPGGFCASGPAQCRVTPDIAMDAAPQSGYIIKSRGLGAGATAVWDIVGGTSGAAPLAAAVTADANEDAGLNLGFANPFLYGTLAEPADFHDIKKGSNSNGTGSSFTAVANFDLVTGLGSLKGSNFAAALATYVATPPTFEHTKLTGTHPLNLKRVKKGRLVDFTGKLTNTDNANTGIRNRQILVIGNGRIIGVDRTDATGVWDIKFKVTKRLSWHAVFMGSDVERPSQSPGRTVRIRH
ncbi:MAG TPA: S53 family peptidase, partial [Gaiellales bacterium]|nr:S53 family peptidase [Gaiellales bacterium]